MLAVAALFVMIVAIRNFSLARYSGRFVFLGIVRLFLALSLGYTSVMMFLKRRDLMLLIGLAAVLFFETLLFFASFSYFMNFLTSFLWLGAWVLTALLVVSVNTNFLPKIRPLAREYWYAPAIVAGFAFLLSLANSVNFIGFLSNLTVLGAIVLICLWNAYPDGVLPQESGTRTVRTADGREVVVAEPGYGFIPMAKHVLLLIFTFGVWDFIWIYRTTRYTNLLDEEEPRSPVREMLFCTIIPGFSIVWMIIWIFKTAKRIDRLAQRRGIDSNIATMCLIFAFFAPIVSVIVMQARINATVEAAGGRPQPRVQQSYQQPAYQQPYQQGYQQPAQSYQQPVQTYQQPAQTYQQPSFQPVQPVQPAAPQERSLPAELRAYKELMDEGIITPEEFEAKKRQLLGR